MSSNLTLNKGLMGKLKEDEEDWFFMRKVNGRIVVGWVSSTIDSWLVSSISPSWKQIA